MLYLNVLFALAFLLSVLVQFNDPDPWLWSLFYASACLCCLAHAVNKLLWQIAALLAALALAACLWLLPQFLGQVSPGEIVESLSMQSKSVEEAREAGGSLLVALWMACLAYSQFSLSRAKAQT
jgi:hypothetical protein